MEDQYKISIRDIILNNSFTGPSSLSSLLDANGYYGRHKIRNVVAKNKSLHNYVIDVYLPNSGITYNWPFKSSYDMSERRINRSRLFKYEHHSPSMSTIMHHILNTGQVFNELGWDTIWPLVQRYQFNSYIHTIRVIETLKLYGIISDNKLILKDPMDIKELYDNLLCKNNKTITK